MKTKSALSYFGSDSEVAADLAAMLDRCKHVTIPFVGGASILPHLTARAIVANDRNDMAINFYRVMSGWYGAEKRAELISACEATLSHPRNIDEAANAIELIDACDENAVYMAWAYWSVCWIGRKGKGGTKHAGGMPSIRRTANGGTNASRIRAAAGDLTAWAEHFARCEWESVCFRELLPKVADRLDCGVYADPPWVGVGRNYLHAFTDQDHCDLASLLRRFKDATVVVRYGDHPAIRELYSDWNIIEASSRDQANASKPELWITNRIEYEYIDASETVPSTTNKAAAR